MKPTEDVAAWREASQATHRLSLRSGLIVFARRVTPMHLVFQGILPLPLADKVWGMLHTIQSNPKALKENAPAINAVCVALIERPTITPDPTEEPGQVWIEEIPIDDRLDVYIWAQQGVAPFVAFPVPRQNGDGCD